MKKIIASGILIVLAILLVVFNETDVKARLSAPQTIPTHKEVIQKAAAKLASGPQRSKVKILDAEEINQILNEDEKRAHILKSEFPEGRLIKEKQLSSQDIAKYFRSQRGEEIVRIYSDNALVSEKWDRTNGSTLFKDYVNSRLGSVSYKDENESWTYFYDSSMNISKKIFRRGHSTFCTLYDSQAPVSTSENNCENDSFRELEDEVD